jgi:O-succinylbenzoic acid--CoA ligase
MTNRLSLDKSFDQAEYFQSLVEQWLDDDVGAIDFETSGSTGQPTKIKLSKELIRASIRRSAEAFNWNDERALIAIPINKTGGKMMVLRTLELHWHARMMKPTSNPLSDLEIDHNFTQISLTPFQLSNVLKSNPDTEKLKRFKNILVGGAPISNSLRTSIHSYDWKDRQIVHTYGMTETASHVAFNELGRNSEEFEVLPGIQWGLNENGQLWFRDSLFDVQTTDLGEVVSKRAFRWLGRTDFTINSGGIKIQPEQLEEEVRSILHETGINRDLAITSRSNDELGEELVLILEGQEIKDSRFLLELLQRNLPQYQNPKLMLFMVKLPRTTSDKIDRMKLSQLV